jgi:carbonic anhydrase
MIIVLLSAAAASASASPTTRTEQQQWTPDQVLQQLMEGNARFVAGKSVRQDWQAQVKASSESQYPKAVILSCLDSRVPVETIFDQGIGDLFVARVAGNVEGRQTLGSMEFATKAAGAKLLMVLGHEACGAVKGAIENVKLGNLTELLEEIRPAVDQAPYEGERTSADSRFVDEVVRQNVMQTLADIRERSPVLRELEESGRIKMVGAYYGLGDGKVVLLTETKTPKPDEKEPARKSD